MCVCAASAEVVTFPPNLDVIAAAPIWPICVHRCIRDYTCIYAYITIYTYILNSAPHEYFMLHHPFGFSQTMLLFLLSYSLHEPANDLCAPGSLVIKEKYYYICIFWL